MKQLLLVLAVILSANITIAQKSVINDPNATVRTVGNFSSINISGGIDLHLSQGNEDAVAVSASEVKYRDRIRTSVENGTLKIWYDNDGLRWNTGNRRLVAYVSFRSIQKLTASGASDVIVNGLIKGDELTIMLSGASDFKGSVQLKKLSMDQSGASDVTISGNTNELHVKAEGASDMKGYDLETQRCTASASGASDIKITVRSEISAVANGASSIMYKGPGVIKESKASGASSINKRG